MPARKPSPAARPRRRTRSKVKPVCVPAWRNVIRLFHDGRMWNAVIGPDPVRGAVASARTEAACLDALARLFRGHGWQCDPSAAAAALFFHPSDAEGP